MNSNLKHFDLKIETYTKNLPPIYDAAIFLPLPGSLFSGPGWSQVSCIGVSNRWSCTTLGDGIEHVANDVMDAEEKALLSELEEHQFVTPQTHIWV